MKRLLCAVTMLLIFSAVSIAQNPRVFITDSKSWEISGGGGGADGAFGGGVKGGARPQTGEIIKTFGERCPSVTVNNKQDKADYVVLLDHEGGKGFVRKDNKVAVFNWDGDSIVSHSTRSLGNAVQDACAAIEKDWTANKARRIAQQANPAPTAAGAPVAAASPAPEMMGKVNIASQPAGADIEIDGSFVGNTPSSINLAPGEHVIAIKKSGFKAWERKMKTTGGEINLNPELEKN